MSLAARQNKGPRKSVPDNNAPGRRPGQAWKTQSSFQPGASRTSTPPATNPAPANGQGFPPLNAAADAKPAGELNGPPPSNGSANPTETFRTDTEISQTGTGARAQRELQAWQAPSDSTLSHSANGGAAQKDDATFGAGASSTSGSWDQFVANEQMFGVTTSFDEDLYTTKLDRSGPDFKERERKAQQIANEIMASTSNNPHLAEERNQTDDSGVNEEDKYGAVVRSANAYVPPGARRTGVNGTPPPTGTPEAPSPAPTGSKAEVPKVKINVPDEKAAKPGGDNLVGTFRDFMATEKKRLEQKRQAIVKNEIDKRVADLVKFSQTFKLNKPIPDDLVTILAKDETKQAQIREKSAQDAAAAGARAIGPSTTTSTNLNASPALAPTTSSITGSATSGNLAAPALGTSTSAAARLPQAKDAATRKAAPPAATPVKASAGTPTSAKGGKPAISMVIQKIPPFNPEKAKVKHAVAVAAPAPASPASPTTDAAKLNASAPAFRPGSTSVSPSPSPAVAAVSPKPSPAVTPAGAVATTSNPFFGTRPAKKPTPVHIKDDFNPFKFAKVVEPNQVTAMWPYNGKRFMLAYPAPAPPPNPPAQQHIPPPGPPPPPSYEEDSAAQQAAQAAARGYMVYYPQYYPGQYGVMPPPPQQMMPGAPGAPGAPPQGYIHPGFVPHMYPAPMPHNAHGQPMYPPPPMPGMPPPQQYLPPGAYPAPNGGPPGSIPATPMPAHAYYHPGPQFAYPMMMAPPQHQPGAPRPPHPYEGAPAPQPGVPMPGQVSHQ